MPQHRGAASQKIGYQGLLRAVSRFTSRGLPDFGPFSPWAMEAPQALSPLEKRTVVQGELVLQSGDVGHRTGRRVKKPALTELEVHWGTGGLSTELHAKESNLGYRFHVGRLSQIYGGTGLVDCHAPHTIKRKPPFFLGVVDLESEPPRKHLQQREANWNRYFPYPEPNAPSAQSSRSQAQLQMLRARTMCDGRHVFTAAGPPTSRTRRRPMSANAAVTPSRGMFTTQLLEMDACDGANTSEDRDGGRPPPEQTEIRDFVTLVEGLDLSARRRLLDDLVNRIGRQHRDILRAKYCGAVRSLDRREV